MHRGNPRWAVTADCPPLLTSEGERDLQHRFDMLAKKKTVGTPFSYVTTSFRHYPLQESHAFEAFNPALKDFVHEQILGLLAPTATGRQVLAFASFSDMMCSILKGIWSGQ